MLRCRANWVGLLIVTCCVAPVAAERKTKEYDYRESAEYRELSKEDQKRVDQVAKDLRLLKKAIKKYIKDHDHQAPEKLSDLVPDYLPRLPKDPFADPKARSNENQQSPSRADYRYRHRYGPSFVKSLKPYTLEPTDDAWEVKSVGLPKFPLRLEPRNHKGLYSNEGYWGQLILDVF